MNQIPMTPLGVLEAMNTMYTNEQLKAMSPDDLRNTMVYYLNEFSNDGVPSLSGLEDSILVRHCAIMLFLRDAKVKTSKELKNMSTEKQTYKIRTFISQKTTIPFRRVMNFSFVNLVQIALMWYTKIDMSNCNGVNYEFDLYTKKQLDKMTPDEQRNTLIVEISQFSSDSVPTLQGQNNTELIGKGAIIAFIRRAKLATDAELKGMSTAAQRELLVKETYFRTGIPYAFFEKITSNAPAPKLVNEISDERLVEISLAWYVIDKPYVKYNEVTSAMAHDSHTGDKYTGKGSPIGKTGHESYRDQDYPIQTQLKSGIRTVRISSTTGADLRHSNVDFGTLQSYLNRVVAFMRENPNEIFTIIDESDWSPTVQRVYKETLGDLLFIPGQNGIPSLSELNNGQWPTVCEMVEKGKRVLLLVNQAYDSAIPFRLPAYDGDGNGMISMNRDDFILGIKIDHRPAEKDYKNGNPKRYSNKNHLYLLNHYFYEHIPVLDDNTSYRAFSKWGNGELLIEYTMAAWNYTKRKPNFLNVDFYSEPGKAGNYLFDLVIAMNRPDAFEPLRVPYLIDRPIYFTDTNHLKMGETYTITCVAKGNNEELLNITRNPNNSGNLHLQPADAQNVHQHWKIVYNTPTASGEFSSGLALVDPTDGFAIYDNNKELSTESELPLVSSDYTIGFDKTHFSMKYLGNNQWMIRKYSLIPLFDFCLDARADGGRISNERTLIRWQWHGGDNQKWIFTKV